LAGYGALLEFLHIEMELETRMITCGTEEKGREEDEEIATRHGTPSQFFSHPEVVVAGADLLPS
jgi:hypothetical protein